MDELTVLQPKTAVAEASSDRDTRHVARLSIQSLSSHDIALLRHIAAGRTNVQIGLCTHRSEKTIRNQLTTLYAKLAAGNRAEAVAIYMRMGGT